MRKWQWVLRQIGSRLWVRASLFCILAIFTALFALLVKDYIPENLARTFGADAVDNILQIIAASMLAVTTFSLSTMISAYSAATSNVTPRSTILLLQDSTAQNALSIFIGAFLFSLVGIIALSMQVYGDSGRLVLFVVTLGVVVLIIGVLLQWISYLSELGRVGSTIDRVEQATVQALERQIKVPFLGGRLYIGEVSEQLGMPVSCSQIGYIQNIDSAALSRLAEQVKGEFFLRVRPGMFNDGQQPLLYSANAVDEDLIANICNAFSIGDSRSFEQDPRFGLVVLSEIAARSLSTAINDPGTAIDIIGTSLRILEPWVNQQKPDGEPLYPNIHVPPLTMADMLDDLYNPLVRDVTGNVQIAVRLQKAFLSLVRMGNGETTAEVVKLSKAALEYADKYLLLQSDKDAVKKIAEEVREYAR